MEITNQERIANIIENLYLNGIIKNRFENPSEDFCNALIDIGIQKKMRLL